MKMRFVASPFYEIRGLFFCLAVAVSLVLIAISGCGFGASSVVVPTTTPSDQTTIETQRHNFGVIRPRSENFHEFAIANSSPQSTWTIKEIKTTCVCTVADVSANSIRPGENLTLKVKYNAPDREGDDCRLILVRFIEPEAPVAKFIISAKMREEVAIIPRRLELSGFIQGTSRTEFLQIENYSGKRWRSVSASSDQAFASPGIADQQLALETKAQTFSLSIAFNLEPNQCGRRDARIKLFAELLDGTTAEVATIPASIVGFPRIRTSPNSILLGRVAPGSSFVKQIEVFFTDPKDRASFENLEFPETAEFPARIIAKTVTATNKLTIDVEIKCPEEPGLIDQKLTFRNSGQIAFSVPLLGLVEERRH